MNQQKHKGMSETKWTNLLSLNILFIESPNILQENHKIASYAQKKRHNA